MGFLIFLLVGYVLLSISLYFVFEKAGEAGWQGLVPGLNFVVWSKITGYPMWKVALLLLPIVNIFIYASLAVRMVRSFDKLSFWHSALAVIATPFFFFYLGLDKKEKYVGPNFTLEMEYNEKLKEAKANGNEREYKKLATRNPYTKSGSREWAEAIIFAVFAAAFIRMFLIEAYVIPTSSMEGSLVVGDFLFVSKAHYGIRTPQTITMLPLLHNRVPVVGGESYLEGAELPYYRLPAIEKIDRNEPVVFNFPEGDSVYIFPGRTYSIYDYRRNQMPDLQAQRIKTNREKLITRPLDKKDHYIKRCIGLPGDSLQIIDREVYINGEKGKKPKYVQFFHLINAPAVSMNTRNFTKWGISEEDLQGARGDQMLVILNEEQREKIAAMDANIIIEEMDIAKLDPTPNAVFPHDPAINGSWTKDNYGPIWIPQKGATVQLSKDNIAFYRRIIGVYEGNTLAEKDGQFIINGEATNEYTFKMDYFWMMGDNRHNSEDSRIWGFVPEDHVVGKPLFVWFSLREGSLAKGISWERIFRSVSTLSN
ncbi:MAG: S26 family signal peptidase [Bacteroidota bacterium]